MRSLRAIWTRVPMRNRVVTIAGAIAFGAVSLAVHANALPHLYFEAQAVACLPWDFYIEERHQQADFHIEHGDLIRFRAKGMQPFFKDGTPMAKLAIGLPGDTIKVEGDRLYVNGRYWGSLARGLQRLKKPSGYWDRTVVVQPGEIFVLGTEPRSFDSRYWGVIHEDQVDGKLRVFM